MSKRVDEIDPTRSAAMGEATFRDELVRLGIPEMKLALGEVIDGENQAPLPSRYARLLPEEVLHIVLRPDAAAALAPILTDLERELTDSCNRHGSLYDRRYRVHFEISPDPDAPLYRIRSGSASGLEGEGGAAGDPPPASGGRAADAGASSVPAPIGRAGPAPSISAPPEGPDASAPGGVPEQLPVMAARGEDDGGKGGQGWRPDAWVLIVEERPGRPRELIPLEVNPATLGRRSADPEYAPTIGISDAPQLSRRQLALIWQERDGAPGFEVVNLGLNPVHLPNRELPGAAWGRRPIDPEAIGPEHIGWIPPGVPFQIGEHGPVVRIEARAPEPSAPGIDPDATIFE